MTSLKNVSRRRFLSYAAAGAGVASLPGLADASAVDGADVQAAAVRLPANRIGAQLYTVRDLVEEDMLGLEGTLELLQDVGISNLELAGTFMGRTPQDLRKLISRYGMKVAGNHFGPRTMDGPNQWYDAAGRAAIYADARALGLEYVGTGHYYNVPLTVDGFAAFARRLNEWGRATSAAGFKFYYHNHDGEFTRFNGRPLFDILIEETDPEHVFFELDLAWTAIAGEDVYEIVRRHQQRLPLFHVKDFWFDDQGPRETKAGTLAEGGRFTFADVGKGTIDWPRLFGVLENPSQHIYFIERDDAGVDEVVNGERPTNPAGSANTVWRSYQYLKNLEF